MPNETSGNNAGKASVLSNHYEAHSKAESYDKAYFYEPGAYMEHLATLVRDRLQLTRQKQQEQQTAQPSRCILDIGGGTGTFAHALMRNDDSNSRVVVVEPFLDPSVVESPAAGKDGAVVSFVKASAEDFLHPPSHDSWRTQLGGYDQILVKEVVHHFKDEDRVGIFRGMREGLREFSSSETNNNNNNNMPSLLIITRPQIDIDYPLWDAARTVWKDNQPSAEDLEADLRAAGYSHIESTIEPIECTISLSRWQAMVKSRCWSTFSNFTDDELEEACAVIAEDASRDPRNFRSKTEDNDDLILRFDDRLIFLAAS